MNKGFLRNFTRRRRRGPIIAAVWLVTLFVYVFPVGFRHSPVEWPVLAVVFTIFGGSFAGAVVLIELLRGIVLRWSNLSDEQHFNW